MFDHLAFLQEFLGVQSHKEVEDTWFKDITRHFNDLTTTLKLPYEAEEHPEIPSIAEIKKGVNLIPRSGFGRKVFRVGDLIVKVSDFTLVQEAEVHLFLQQHSKVRVPKVYALFYDEASGPPHDTATDYFLVMENIPGAPISSESWVSFEPETRRKICFRMAEQLRLLRDTPAPAYYGQIHNRGWWSFLKLLATRCQEPCGPYDSYSSFCNAAIKTRRYEVARDLNDPHIDEEEATQKRQLLSEFEAKLPLWHETSQPTFTHIDPNPGNIVARQIEDAQGGEDWEITFIDWTQCGWFPKWMQAVTWHESHYITTQAPDGTVTMHTELAKEVREMMFHQMGEDTYDEQVDMFDRTNEEFLGQVF